MKKHIFAVSALCLSLLFSGCSSEPANTADGIENTAPETQAEDTVDVDKSLELTEPMRIGNLTFLFPEDATLSGDSDESCIGAIVVREQENIAFHFATKDALGMTEDTFVTTESIGDALWNNYGSNPELLSKEVVQIGDFNVWRVCFKTTADDSELYMVNYALIDETYAYLLLFSSNPDLENELLSTSTQIMNSMQTA